MPLASHRFSSQMAVQQFRGLWPPLTTLYWFGFDRPHPTTNRQRKNMRHGMVISPKLLNPLPASAPAGACTLFFVVGCKGRQKDRSYAPTKEAVTIGTASVPAALRTTDGSCKWQMYWHSNSIATPIDWPQLQYSTWLHDTFSQRQSSRLVRLLWSTHTAGYETRGLFVTLSQWLNESDWPSLSLRVCFIRIVCSEPQPWIVSKKQVVNW